MDPRGDGSVLGLMSAEGPRTHTSYGAGSFHWDGTWLADSFPTRWAGGLILALSDASLMVPLFAPHFW